MNADERIARLRERVLARKDSDAMRRAMANPVVDARSLRASEGIDSWTIRRGRLTRDRLKAMRFAIDERQLHERARPLSIGGHQVLRMDDHDLVAHLLLHQFSHYFDRRLKWAVDIEAITSLTHAAGARVVVDGVAYAPHRAIDVSAWDVDWYAYSTYKVYGPHMAALWGRRDALAELPGPNHFFVPDEELPYKFELGGANHEGCAGICGLRDYLATLIGEADPRALDRAAIEQAFGIMTACELPLQARLIEYLRSRDDVRIIGPTDDGDSRVGTISFVHDSKSSAEITAAVDSSGIGIRHGHMYAYHLCEAAGLDPEDGVVRTSLVHYNTPEEIERLIEVFDKVLG